MKIILASTSPRRQELLGLAHISFDVLDVQINETQYPHETPSDYITRMVLQKAQEACLHVKQSALILTADTIGVLDDNILTKPNNKADAFAMWTAMSGRTHEIWTAVQATLVKDGQTAWQQSTLDKTIVQFLPISQSMMEYYWQTGEPCDKAGAYAIQGFGATWVCSITGNYSNVVGLPLPSVLRLIELAKRAYYG